MNEKATIDHELPAVYLSFKGKQCICIHVINFKEASGRFFFHFLEVFEKCIGYIRKVFIHFPEVSKFW